MAVALSLLGVLGTAALSNGEPDVWVSLCGTDNVPGSQYDLTRALSAGGTVRFDCGGQTKLRVTFTHEIAGVVTIDGGGVMTLTGDDLQSLFRLRQGARLTLRNVTITGGKDPRPHPLPFPGSSTPVTDEHRVQDGGVIQNAYGGDILIQSSELRANTGPIRTVGGSLTIRDSFFTDNRATAIKAYGARVEIERSHFWNNEAGFFGGALLVSGGTLVIRDRTEFIGNRGYVGGALAAWGPSELERVTFFGNRALHGGAIQVTSGESLEIRHGRFEANVATLDGGAVYRSNASNGVAPRLFITHTNFVKNTARDGGAIAMAPGSVANDGMLTLRNVIFSQNEASRNGGAVAVGGMGVDVAQSIFLGNEAAVQGGALFLQLENFHARGSRVVNSLLARNHAPGGGAALAILPPWINLFRFPIYGSRVHFINSTIADNAGDGIRVVKQQIMPTWTPVLLANTIVAGNAGENCGGPTFWNEGHNLQFPGATCGTSIPAGPPLFGPYYVPIAWSPARGRGDDAVCAAQPIDKKDLFGETRSLPGPCTIGAIEREIDRLVRRRSDDRPQDRPPDR